MVSAEALATVEAEKARRLDEVLRLGLAAGAMKAARVQAAINPAKAAALAEMARTFAEQAEPPSFAADMLTRLGLYDEAIKICKRAIDDHGHDSLRAKLATLQDEAERRNLESALSRACAALLADNSEEALAVSREILGREPQCRRERARDPQPAGARPPGRGRGRVRSPPQDPALGGIELVRIHPRTPKRPPTRPGERSRSPRCGRPRGRLRGGRAANGETGDRRVGGDPWSEVVGDRGGVP